MKKPAAGLPTLQRELETAIEQVRSGALPRRRFIARLAARGVAAPLAALLLADAGIAQPAPASAAPARRGGGGTLKLLYWQGPTLLNPHFASGVKDQDASRIFYESLARYDADGNLVPVLAAELPSRANGGLATDGRSVTWKLKRGVLWHDGQPFSADDVLFNWKYATDPATAATTSGLYQGLKLEKLDAHTVRVVFDQPAPFWPASIANAMLIPQHVFAPYAGGKSRDAPANLKPVGTGPYRFVDFRPGDLLRAELNPQYHQPTKPFFDTLEIKGGGDAVSAARAVLQTGEYDFAWNAQVEDEILLKLEAGGRGRTQPANGGGIEAIHLNATDPNVEVDGERSSLKTRHPLFSDPAVRQAIGLLIDRTSIQRFIYGRAASATTNYINNPARFRSPNTRAEFNPDKAAAVLDAAGWKPGPDGVRSKGGKRLKLLFQTSTNGPRQKTQAIVKQAAAKAGIEIELKAVTGAVFFSADAGNPDTYGKFYADIQMYARDMARPDPERLVQALVSWKCASKANKWLGVNLTRWQNAEFDAAWRAAAVELDATKRTALFIRMNDLAVADGYVIPLLYRPVINALEQRLQAPISGWDYTTAALADWSRRAA